MNKNQTPLILSEEDARKLFDRLDQDHKNFQTLFERLDRLEDTLKMVVRRQDTHQKALDIFDSERSILEDLIVLTRSVQELLKQHKGHQEIMNKDVKSDIADIQKATEAIPEEIKQAVDSKMNQLIKSVEKKKELIFTLPKTSLIKRIFKFFKFW